jgi:hypothetical protein
MGGLGGLNFVEKVHDHRIFTYRILGHVRIYRENKWPDQKLEPSAFRKANYFMNDVLDFSMKNSGLRTASLWFPVYDIFRLWPFFGRLWQWFFALLQSGTDCQKPPAVGTSLTL